MSFSRMFAGCESLESPDLNHFDTSNFTEFSRMFSGCESLAELDPRIFNTNNVRSFSGMFENCRNLQKLRISSAFKICAGADTDNMFKGCEKPDLTSMKAE